MATINDYLKAILNAVKGKEVRQSIHDAIQQCYKDATGNPESVAAFTNRVSAVETRLETIINDDVVSNESTYSSEKIQSIGSSAAKAKLINEATTEYGGGFRLYLMGSLLIVENIPGLLTTGTVSDRTLFTYDESFPKVAYDQTYDAGNNISITLTTNRELKFTASGTNFTVISGLELFMSDSLL